MDKQINAKDILQAILKRYKIIIAVTLLFAVGSYLYTHYMVTPLYRSHAKLYVENKITSGETITSSDLSAGQRLANTCSQIFKTDAVLDPIAKTLREEDGIVLSTGQLSGMISVVAVDESEILQVSVTSTDPELSRRVTEILVDIAPNAYKSIINTGTMKRLNTTIAANRNPISPNVKGNIVKGALAGAVVSIALALIVDLFDTKVKSEDDLFEMYNIPVFAEVMDFNLKSGGFYGRYGKYGKYGRYGKYKAYYTPKKES